MIEQTPQEVEADHKEYVRNKIIAYICAKYPNVPELDLFYIIREIEHGKINHLTINFEVKS